MQQFQVNRKPRNATTRNWNRPSQEETFEINHFLPRSVATSAALRSWTRKVDNFSVMNQIFRIDYGWQSAKGNEITCWLPLHPQPSTFRFWDLFFPVRTKDSISYFCGQPHIYHKNSVDDERSGKRKGATWFVFDAYHCYLID